MTTIYRCEYSGATVTKSEPKAIKPLKGEIRGTGIRSPRVWGQGGISGEIKEIGKNAKGGGIGGAPRAPGGKVAEGPSEKSGLTLDCGWTVLKQSSC